MTRTEMIHVAACAALHPSENEAQGRGNAKMARRAAEQLADELGLTDEAPTAPGPTQAELDAANARIAELEAQLAKLRADVGEDEAKPTHAAASPTVQSRPPKVR